MSRSLSARCAQAFGGSVSPDHQTSPWRALDLFRSASTHGVEATEHVYATNGSKQLELDLYQTRDRSDLQPIVLMIHGGSWNGGNKEELAAINRYLTRRKYSVAAINYRHAPKFKFPAAVDDTFRAIEFLRANAPQLGLDPTRIVLVGRSAGGQIALSVAYAGKDPAIRGVVSLYGPADLVLGYEKPSRPGVLDSRKVLEDYLSGTPTQNPESYAAASPVNFVNAATPPTLLIHGGLDPMVWPIHNEQLAERLRAAGRPHLYLHLPWATHGCEANIRGPSGQLSLYAIERFLAFAFAQPGKTLVTAPLP